MANMEALLKDDILHVGLNLMIFIGERLHYKSKKLILFRIFNCSVMVSLLVFAFANFTQAELGMYVRNVQTIVSIFHMFFKYTLYIYYKPDLENILASTLKFWNYRRFNEKVLMEATSRIYKIINGIQVTAVVTSLVAVLMYFLKPAFNQNDVFIIDAWIFANSLIVDVTVLSCQYYFFVIITAIVIGYDTIYLSLCTHLVLQIRLLKRRLQRLSKSCEENAETELRYCIEYHQFLVKIFSRMKRVYSLTLLFHYFVTLLTGCFDLYELLIRKSNISYMVVMVISLAFIYAQFGYYVMPADIVASEFSELSQSIYMTNWYKNTAGVQKLLLFMMTKSQRQEYFDGGGVIAINIYTYGSVVRKTFSFYAILRTMFDV